MRLLGGCLLAAAGLLCGLWGVRELAAGRRRSESYAHVLALIAWELERFRTPLPDLFAALGERLSGPGGSLCRRAGAALARGETIAAAWEAALAGADGEERAILRPLGDVLGRYGAEEQLGSLRTARMSMEALAAERRRGLGERRRLWLGLCTAGGLFLAVLLW